MENSTGSPFDSRAAEWDSPPRRRMAEAFLGVLLARLEVRPGMRVLDFGAGTGLLAIPLAVRGALVWAADTSAGMLEVLAAKQAANVVPVLLEGGEVPGGPFDLVVSSMTLHHVRDVAGLLGRFFDVLVPGGGLAVFDLDEEGGEFHHDRTGVEHDGFSRSVFRGWLEAAQFVSLQMDTVHTVRRIGRSGEERAFSVFLALAKRGSG